MRGNFEGSEEHKKEQQRNERNERGKYDAPADRGRIRGEGLRKYHRSNLPWLKNA